MADIRVNALPTLSSVAAEDILHILDASTTNDVDSQTTVDAVADWIIANKNIQITGIDDVPGLRAALDSKADIVHTHTVAQVIGLQADLDAKTDITQAQIIGRNIVLNGKSINVPSTFGGLEDDRIPDTVVVGEYLQFGTTDGGINNITGDTLKGDLALNLVNNTADVSKPVSTLQQAALDLKVDTTTYTTGQAAQDTTIATNRTDIDTALAAISFNTAKISFDTESSTKLATIETGADITDTTNVWSSLGISNTGSTGQFLTQRGVFAEPSGTGGFAGLGAFNVWTRTNTFNDNTANGSIQVNRITAVDDINTYIDFGAANEIFIRSGGIPFAQFTTNEIVGNNALFNSGFNDINFAFGKETSGFWLTYDSGNGVINIDADTINFTGTVTGLPSGSTPTTVLGTTGQIGVVTVGNTATVSLDSVITTAITANTAKTGITAAESSAIATNTTKNSYPTADATKLAGIETAADVTDTANVVGSLTAGTNITIATDGTISAASGGSATTVLGTANEIDVNTVGNTATASLNTAITNAITANTAKVDVNALNQVGAAVLSTDSVVYLAGGPLAPRRKTFNLVPLSIMNNDAGFTTNTGTVTSVTGTTNEIDIATGTTTPVVSISSTVTDAIDLNTTKQSVAGLTQVGGAIIASDSVLYYDNTTPRRKTFSSVPLSVFNNDSGFITGITKANVDTAIGSGTNDTDYYASDKTWKALPSGGGASTGVANTWTATQTFNNTTDTGSIRVKRITGITDTGTYIDAGSTNVIDIVAGTDTSIGLNAVNNTLDINSNITTFEATSILALQHGSTHDILTSNSSGVTFNVDRLDRDFVIRKETSGEAFTYNAGTDTLTTTATNVVGFGTATTVLGTAGQIVASPLSTSVTLSLDPLITGAISTNTGNISTNAADISTNATGISTNVTNIGTNATNIGTNTTALDTKGDALSIDGTQINLLEGTNILSSINIPPIEAINYPDIVRAPITLDRQVDEFTLTGTRTNVVENVVRNELSTITMLDSFDTTPVAAMYTWGNSTVTIPNAAASEAGVGRLIEFTYTDTTVRYDLITSVSANTVGFAGGASVAGTGTIRVATVDPTTLGSPTGNAFIPGGASGTVTVSGDRTGDIDVGGVLSVVTSATTAGAPLIVTSVTLNGGNTDVVGTNPSGNLSIYQTTATLQISNPPVSDIASSTSSFSYDPDTANTVYTSSVPATAFTTIGTGITAHITQVANAIAALETSITWDGVITATSIGSDAASSVTLDLGTTSNIDSSFSISGGTNNTEQLVNRNGFNGGIATTVTVTDGNSNQVYSQTFLAASLTTPNIDIVGQAIADAVTNNVETPINFDGAYNSATKVITLRANTTGEHDDWSITIDNNGQAVNPGDLTISAANEVNEEANQINIVSFPDGTSQTTAFPSPPATGTFTLQSVDGILSWI